MFEKCRDIGSCELTLQEQIAGLNSLGELVPEPEDLILMNRLLVERLRNGTPTRVIRSLVSDAPRFFAYYLTWAGIVGYEEGRFWPPILDALELSGQRWESIIGNAFLECLLTIGLETPEIDGANRFVTAILMQGGVPDSCAPSFYQHVVRYFSKNGITTPDAISTELDILRRDEMAESARSRRVTELYGLIDAQQREINRLKRFLEIQTELRRLNERLTDVPEHCQYLLEEGDTLLARWNDTEHRLSEDLRRYSILLQDLQAREAAEFSVVEQFSDTDQRIIGLATEIESLREAWTALSAATRDCTAAQTEVEACQVRISSLLEELDHLPGSPARSLLNCLDADEDWSPPSLVALQQAVNSRETIERTMCECGWISSNHVQEAGTAFRYRGKLWLHPVGWTAAAGALWAQTWVAWAQLQSVPWLSLVGSIGVSIGAVFRSKTALRLGKRRQQLEKSWVESGREVEAALAAMGIDVSASADLKSGDCDLLGQIVEDYRTHQLLLAKLRTVVENVEELRQHIQMVQGRIDDIVCGDLKSPPVCLEHLLRQALIRKKNAVDSQTRIETDLHPRLGAVLKIKLVTQLTLLLGRRKLQSLGHGDVSAGANTLREVERTRLAVSELNDELIELEDIVAEYGEQPEEQLSEQLEHLSSLEAERESLEAESRYYVPAFPYADEPVSRFVIYGGEPATRFVTESVQRFFEYRRGSRLAKRNAAVGTPHTLAVGQISAAAATSRRVSRTFGIWLDSEEEGHLNEMITESNVARTATPSIVLRPSRREICMTIPEVRVPPERLVSPPTARLLSGSKRSTRVLTALRADPDLSVLVRSEWPIPAPSEQCHIEVTSGDTQIAEWIVDLSRVTAFPSLFNYRTGANIPDRSIGPEVVWALVPPGWRLCSDVHVIQTDTLTDEWSGFQILLLDAATVTSGELRYVLEGRKASYQVQIGLADDSRPVLVGELADFILEGEVVYLGVPAVRVPVPSADDLERWGIQLWSVTGNGPDDIVDVCHSKLTSLHPPLLLVNSQTATVMLDQIIDAPDDSASCHMVRLVGPRGIRVVHKFWVISDAAVWCSPAVRPPLSQGHDDETNDDTIADVILPDTMAFEPMDPDSLLAGEPGYARVRAGGGTRAIEGWVIQRDVRLGFYYPLPRVHVCLSGLEPEPSWTDRVLNAWIGDLQASPDTHLCVLIRDAQHQNLCRAELHLEGSRHVAIRRLDTDSTPRGLERPPIQIDFDLAQFFESMRALRNEAILSLSLYSSCDGATTKVLDHAVLLRVGVQWTVHDMMYSMAMDGPRPQSLAIYWSESGRQQNRIISLWSKTRPWDAPISASLPDSVTEAQFDIAKHGLRPEPYLVCISTLNPWEPAKNLDWSLDETNVFAIDLSRSCSSISHLHIDSAARRAMQVLGKMNSQDVGATGGTRTVLVASLYGGPALEASLEQTTCARTGAFGVRVGGRGVPPIAVMVASSNSGFGRLAMNPNATDVLLDVNDDIAELVLRALARTKSDLVLRVGSRSPKSSPRARRQYGSELERMFGEGLPWLTVPRDYHEQVLSALGSDSAPKIKLYTGKRTEDVTLSIAGNGQGTAKVPNWNWTRCLRCGSVFTSQEAFNSYEHRHRQRCPADHFEVRYDRVGIQVALVWRPFAAVRALLERHRSRFSIDDLSVVHSWMAGQSSPWISLFGQGRERDLACRLLEWECKVIDGLERVIEKA